LHPTLASLGVLMGSITADIIAPTVVPLHTVRVYSERLKAWHANLPESLTLSAAVRESYESPRKTPTLLIHCAYLTAITTLTRRLLIEETQECYVQNNMSCHTTRSEAAAISEEYSKMCLSAAKQLATVRC